MSVSPFKRRVRRVRWGFRAWAVLFVMLVLVGIATTRWSYCHNRPYGTSWAVDAGHVWFRWWGGGPLLNGGDPNYIETQSWYHPSFRLEQQWPIYDVPRTDGSAAVPCFVSLPVWLILLPFAMPGPWMWWWIRKHSRPGCCVRCGYNLAGQPAKESDRACPECNESFFARLRSLRAVFAVR